MTSQVQLGGDLLIRAPAGDGQLESAQTAWDTTDSLASGGIKRADWQSLKLIRHATLRSPLYAHERPMIERPQAGAAHPV